MDNTPFCVDLDAIEERLATRYGEVVTMKADDVLALVAELRAAREVVKAVQAVWATSTPSDEEMEMVGCTLAEYDYLINGPVG